MTTTPLTLAVSTAPTALILCSKEPQPKQNRAETVSRVSGLHRRRWLAALDDFRNWLIREAAQVGLFFKFYAAPGSLVCLGLGLDDDDYRFGTSAFSDASRAPEADAMLLGGDKGVVVGARPGERVQIRFVNRAQAGVK